MQAKKTDVSKGVYHHILNALHKHTNITLDFIGEPLDFFYLGNKIISYKDHVLNDLPHIP